MEQICLLLAALGYTGAAVGTRAGRAGAILAHPALIGVVGVLHVAALVIPVSAAGSLPLGSLRWTLAALGAGVVVLGLALRRQPRMRLLGELLIAWSGLMVGLGAVAPARRGAEELAAWFILHVGLSLVGIAAFVGAFSFSALYLVVRGRLKRKDLRGIGTLPTLETLDRLNTRAMATGFVTLSLGMAIGGAAAAIGDRSFFRPDVTTWATVAIGLWYAVGLYLRLVMGWRGRLGAMFGLVGFSGVLLLIGVAMLLSGSWHGATV